MHNNDMMEDFRRTYERYEAWNKKQNKIMTWLFVGAAVLILLAIIAR